MVATRSSEQHRGYHVQDREACLINMLCVFLGRPAMASAVVETRTEAVVIPAAALRHWVETEPDARRFIFESMAGQSVDVVVLAEELAFRNMDQSPD